MPYLNTITGQYELDRPHRIRLESGLTATGPEITEQILESQGWIWEDYPVPPAPIDSSIVTTSTNTIL